MDQGHHKDFDGWNQEKKNIENRNKTIYCHAREIWWSVLGLNIGVETDGKGINFERPILIVKVYNKHSILVLPLTTKIKNDKYHYKIIADNKVMYVKLTQVRTIDTKRLLRKIDIVSNLVFEDITRVWKINF